MAKFKVQFPVICYYYSVCLIGQDRSMQPEVIFPDSCHILRCEWRLLWDLAVKSFFNSLSVSSFVRFCSFCLHVHFFLKRAIHYLMYVSNVTDPRIGSDN